MRIYYCPGSHSLILDTKTEASKKDEGKLQSWDTFEFLGRFPIHTYPAPPLIPKTTLEAEFFFPVATLYRAREGELHENFEKDALFYGSLCLDSPLSPPFSCCNSCLF